MPSRTSRPALSLFQLLLILAVLVILLALLLPALARIRLAAAQNRSRNNLKQLGIAIHNYFDVHNTLPPGCDAQGFSVPARLLPFLEQGGLYNQIDFKKPVDARENAQARKVRIPTLVSPLDPVRMVSMDHGPTSYLFCAGSQYALEKNDGIFYQDSQVGFAQIRDGSSNTIMAGETLRGDSGVRAMSVQRQHVRLKKAALKDLGPESGVESFKKDQDIAANRCASWMDGHFLQGTFTMTRLIDDERPDVDCGGAGGLSGLRGLMGGVNILMADGSVRFLTPRVEMSTLKGLATRAGAEVLGDY